MCMLGAICLHTRSCHLRLCEGYGTAVGAKCHRVCSCYECLCRRCATAAGARKQALAVCVERNYQYLIDRFHAQSLVGRDLGLSSIGAEAPAAALKEPLKQEQSAALRPMAAAPPIAADWDGAPAGITYTAATRACVKDGLWQQALGQPARQTAALMPVVVSFTTTISACVKVCKAAGARPTGRADGRLVASCLHLNYCR
jgi:hypothetical protein